MEQSKSYEFDVALSFADEDRHIAFEIAKALKDNGIKVFYDEFEKANLWGKDLYEHLADVYSNKARYCVMIISLNYSKKNWTTHERRNAQARAFKENKEYILPLRLDKTEIPGLPETVGYVDLTNTSITEVVELIKKKLGSSALTKPGIENQNDSTTYSSIPLPNRNKPHTELERDKFLKSSFQFIKNYFKKGLEAFQNKYDDIETDLDEINNFKFICKIYANGKKIKACKKI